MDIFTIHPSEIPIYYLEATLVFAGVFTIGRWFNRFFFERLGGLSQLNGPLRLGLDGATGWTVTFIVFLILAVFNVLWVWDASLVIGGLFLVSTVALWRKSRLDFDHNLRAYLHYGPLLVIGLAILLGALKPPGAWDYTMYHLPYARSILEHHGLSVEPYLRYPFLPEHLYLVFAWVLRLKDEYLVQIVNCAFPLLTITLIYGAQLRYTQNAVLSYLGVLGFLLNKSVFGMVGYAYVDHALVFFITAMLVSLSFFAESKPKNPIWLWLAALYAGDAIGVKFFGLMAIVPVFLWLLCQSKSPKTLVKFFLIVFGVGGFWYLRSFYITGNPVHPVANSLFGYYMWNAEDIRQQFLEQASLGLHKDLLHLVYGLFSGPVQAYFAALGFLGVLFWKDLAPGLRLYWVFALIYYLLWFYIAQVDRYLWPLLPPASILGGYVLYLSVKKLSPYLKGRVLRMGKILMWIAILSVSLVLLVGRYSKYIKIERDGFESVLTTSGFPSYSVMHQANDFKSSYGDVLIHIGLENGVYFFKGRAIGDHFGPGRYSQWFQEREELNQCGLKSPHELAIGLNAFSARLLAIDLHHFCIDEQALLERFDMLYRDDYALLLGLREQTE